MSRFSFTALTDLFIILSVPRCSVTRSSRQQKRTAALSAGAAYHLQVQTAADLHLSSYATQDLQRALAAAPLPRRTQDHQDQVGLAALHLDNTHTHPLLKVAVVLLRAGCPCEVRPLLEVLVARQVLWVECLCRGLEVLVGCPRPGRGEGTRHLVREGLEGSRLRRLAVQVT